MDEGFFLLTRLSQCCRILLYNRSDGADSFCVTAALTVMHSLERVIVLISSAGICAADARRRNQSEQS